MLGQRSFENSVSKRFCGAFSTDVVWTLDGNTASAMRRTTFSLSALVFLLLFLVTVEECEAELIMAQWMSARNINVLVVPYFQPSFCNY